MFILVIESVMRDGDGLCYYRGMLMSQHWMRVG